MLNIANNSQLNTARFMHRGCERSDFYPTGGPRLNREIKKQNNGHRSPYEAYVFKLKGCLGKATTSSMYKKRGMTEEAEFVDAFGSGVVLTELHARRRRERDQYNKAKRNGYAI